MGRLTDYQKKLIYAMNLAGAEYLVIGGVAIRAHGLMRTTRDIDLLIGPTIKNANLLNPIFVRRFQFQEGHTPAKLTELGKMLTDKEKGIDILTSIDGFDFASAYARSCTLTIDGCRMRVPSIPDLIETKKASLASGNDANAHRKDAADIHMLEAEWEHRQKAKK